ncbi:TPA: acyltransferase [Escherichia coli]|nr:acyltransferase [Escherichia coli]HBC5706309.1 acyltransferase [Escherichia coli]
MKKVKSIHYLRGVAALLVVAYHNKQYLNEVYAQKDLGDLLFISGGFGVDLFFIISGFIIMLSSQKKETNSPINFMTRRFFRIYPVFFICTILFFLLNPVFTESELLRSLFLLHLDYYSEAPFFGYNVLYPAWTLTFEVYFYFIFMLAISLSHKNRLLISVIALIVPLLLIQLKFSNSLSLSSKFTIGDTGHWHIGFLNLMSSPMLLEFVYGMFLYIIHRKFKYIKNAKAISFLLVSFGVCSYFYQFRFGHGPLNFGLWAASIITGVLLYEVNFGLRENKILSKLGDISYSLYLSHAIVMLFLINFKDFIPLYEKPGFSKFSFIIALSLFLSFFIYKYIETPFINIGKTISKRLSKPTLTYRE